MNTLMRVNNLPSLIENFFGRDMDELFSQRAMQNVPAVNVVEHADGFRIEVAALGLKKNDRDGGPFQTESKSQQPDHLGVSGGETGAARQSIGLGRADERGKVRPAGV